MKDNTLIKMKDLDLECLKVERLLLRETKKASMAETERLRQETELATVEVQKLELQERMMLGLTPLIDQLME